MLSIEVARGWPLNEPARLQTVDRPRRIEVLREAQVGPGEPSAGRHPPQRGPVTAGPDWKHHRERIVKLDDLHSGRQLLGDLGHGRVLEHGSHRDLEPQLRADPPDEPDDLQGATAAVEEVVLDTDPFHPEYLGKQSRKLPLQRGARRAVLLAGRRQLGQLGGVHLPVGGQR